MILFYYPWRKQLIIFFRVNINHRDYWSTEYWARSSSQSFGEATKMIWHPDFLVAACVCFFQTCSERQPLIWLSAGKTNNQQTDCRFYKSCSANRRKKQIWIDVFEHFFPFGWWFNYFNVAFFKWLISDICILSRTNILFLSDIM